MFLSNVDSRRLELLSSPWLEVGRASVEGGSSENDGLSSTGAGAEESIFGSSRGLDVLGSLGDCTHGSFENSFVRRVSDEFARTTVDSVDGSATRILGASDRERGRPTLVSLSVGAARRRSFFGSTGCDPRGENSRSLAVTGGELDEEYWGARKGADLGGCSEESGTRFTSSAVVLIKTGAPISSSRTPFD